MSDNPYSHLHVEFYADAVKNERLSAESGRPVFEDAEFVRIKFVGDKNNVLVAPAHSTGTARDPFTNERMTYAQQFPKHYEAFQKHQEFRGTGAPLEEIGLSQAKIKELNAANIYTVEALAGMDGTLLQKLGMGAREMKTKAEEYLDRTKSGVGQLAAENADLRARLERMEQMLANNAGSMLVGAAPSYDISASPFADWDADTIKLWLEEQGAPKPRHKAGLEKLIQLADEWNTKLAQDKAA